MNRKMVLLVMIAACGKKGGGGGAAATVTKADADAANAAVPADLKSKIEFEVRTIDDGMKHHPTKYTFAAPKNEVEPYKILPTGAKTKAQVYGVSHRHREVTSFALAGRST